VRQGSVLSPFLFAIYLDDVFDYRCNKMSRLIILYADAIMILTHSVSELQLVLTACEQELLWLDMSINSKKSCCMRIGPRFNVKCNITTSSGFDLPWVNEIRHLGIYISLVALNVRLITLNVLFIDRSMPYLAILACQLLSKSLLT